MITTKQSHLGLAGDQVAGELRRGGVALPLALYFTPNPQKPQMRPPGHLVGDEIGLWLLAEQAKERGDRDEYWQARRAMLLAQASRY